MRKSIHFKKKTIKKIFYFIIFILIVAWIFYPANDNQEFSNKDNLIEEKKILVQDDFFNVNKLHWTNIPLKYKLNNLGCSDVQINHFLKGLNEIKNLTGGLVDFIEIFAEDYDLKVNCVSRDFLIEKLTICEEVIVYGNPQTINWYNDGHINRSERRFISATRINQTENMRTYNLCSVNLKDVGFNLDYEVLGEGGPLEIEGNRILKGEVNLYQGFDAYATCVYPSKEIHELLHSFGFDHVEEPYWDPYYGYVDWEPTKDIMFPRLYCQYQKEINKKYVSCLKHIYSNGEVGFCGGDVNFIDFVSECSKGRYPVDGTKYCCPEPNMRIINGYCDY